jgi:hypothetical protein
VVRIVKLSGLPVTDRNAATRAVLRDAMWAIRDFHAIALTSLCPDMLAGPSRACVDNGPAIDIDSGERDGCD